MARILLRTIQFESSLLPSRFQEKSTCLPWVNPCFNVYLTGSILRLFPKSNFHQELAILLVVQQVPLLLKSGPYTFPVASEDEVAVIGYGPLPHTPISSCTIPRPSKSDWYINNFELEKFLKILEGAETLGAAEVLTVCRCAFGSSSFTFVLIEVVFGGGGNACFMS